LPFISALGALALGAFAACSHGGANPPATATQAASGAGAATGAAATAPAASHDHGAQAGSGQAQLFGNLGGHHRAITTRVPEAQRYFDEALNLLYGFNHDEAIRSFTAAARLDPRCAMCFWGIALANGPHINNPSLDPDHARAAWDAIGKAQAAAQAGGANPTERALIDALARRYAADPKAERPALDAAYAAAMRAVFKAHPDDSDAGALFAEAMMDLRPWDLYTHDGTPQPGTDELVAALETVLGHDATHPGANHFYIHALEASRHPERALAAADRLHAGLVPGAGHLVHMPAHIYIRVGRYEEAADANRRAIAADDAYVKRSPDQGFYLMYKAHNFQFLYAAAMMEGRSAEALQAARSMVAQIPPPMIEQMAEMMDGFFPAPLFVMVRFGRWDEVLAEPDYSEKLPISRALRHFCRGLALLRKGQLEEATKEQTTLADAAASTGERVMMMFDPARTVLGIARDQLAGEIAVKRGHLDVGIKLLEAAVRGEDSLHYNEPPTWSQPVRHTLGAVLLEAGRARAAEAVYRADLERNPNNGWALFGLLQALKARHGAEAADVEHRFKQAWEHADISLKSSRL
jgi:tetratricopeptide (TPR) repeat protein